MALKPGWTMVIAFFNEERFLPATLASIAAQVMRPLTLVLVDNGSTDDGAAAARVWAAGQVDLEVRVLREVTPGQVFGLAAGIAAVETEFVAIGDADTIYPPDYLVKAGAVFAATADVVAVFAHDSAGAPGSWRERWVRAGRDAVLLGVFRGQTYAGGYAHCYRTRALRAAGGYSPESWPYVLKDHELVNRVSKFGRFGRSPDLWVLPSDRRADRGGVRWTLFERVLYHATPFWAKDWFFYRFLGPRLEGRGMRDTALRTRGWDLMG
ncbi:glycosyltransferase [Sandarakinorhabdus glacialis]|nr:glycosyltransferase [Polymorphobacter glacialis]